MKTLFAFALMLLLSSTAWAQGVVLPGGGAVGGSGTSDTTEATQLLVLDELEAINLELQMGIGGGSGDLLLDGNTVLPIVTGDPTYPFLLPIGIVNPDGSLSAAGTVNYHDNAPLAQQDGPVGLCKSWAGVPDPLTFNTNLTWLHCNTYGDQFVIPALDGVALFAAAAVSADNTALPTTTIQRSVLLGYDGSTLDMLRNTAADGLLVNLGSNNDVVVSAANGLSIIACNLQVTGAPNSDSILIALSGSLVTYICSMHIDAEATVDTRIISGTGSACGTSTTQMSPLYAFSTTTGVLGTNEGSGLGMIMKSDEGEDVCIDVSASVINNIRLTYAQF